MSFSSQPAFVFATPAVSAARSQTREIVEDRALCTISTASSHRATIKPFSGSRASVSGRPSFHVGSSLSLLSSSFYANALTRRIAVPLVRRAAFVINAKEEAEVVVVEEEDAPVPESPFVSASGGDLAKSESKPAFDVDFDVDALTTKAKEIAEDIKERPVVYLKNGALVGTGFFLLLIAASISDAFNRVPLLPNVLQLVGLSYVAWFAYRFLLFAESREELRNKIDDFIGKL